MSDWKQRLVEEHQQLYERLTKLSAFISGNPTFSALSADHKEILRRQRDAMLDYEDALSERLLLLD